MKEHTFLKFDNVVKKLSVLPDMVGQYTDELVKENVLETETFSRRSWHYKFRQLHYKSC